MEIIIFIYYVWYLNCEKYVKDINLINGINVSFRYYYYLSFGYYVKFLLWNFLVCYYRVIFMLVIDIIIVWYVSLILLL